MDLSSVEGRDSEVVLRGSAEDIRVVAKQVSDKVWLPITF